ncbi:putative hydrolase (alpha/beta hydrolase fold) [Streptomyces narbonensis]
MPERPGARNGRWSAASHREPSGRVLRGAPPRRTDAHYGAVAAELLDLRDRFPLPPGLPVTVLAAPDGSARWERRQRALARRLGASYEAAVPSGHLVMLDRPDAVARAVLSTIRS